MFLSFDSNEVRAAFLEFVQEHRPDLMAKLRLAQTQPVVVGQGLTADEAAWLRQNMARRGKVHQDIQFTPMEP